MGLFILALVSCATRNPATTDDWHQANLRKQQVMFLAEPGLMDGWFATQIPLEMAEELLGREVLARCLAGVESDGTCAVQLHDCMEVSVPRSWPEDVAPYVMVGFNAAACPTLMTGPDAQWSQDRKSVV